MPRQKKLIEHAYREGERLGLTVWCADEAGPYRAIPRPGSSWQPAGEPARYPHEYVRGGTAKLLTLYHPTGQARVKGVTRTPDAILHPWLETELSAIVAAAATAGSGGGVCREPGGVGALAGKPVRPLHPAGRSATLMDAPDPG